MDAQKIANATLQAAAIYRKWRADFLAQMKEAMTAQDTKAKFAALPPELKEAMEKADPEAYKQLTDELEIGENYG